MHRHFNYKKKLNASYTLNHSYRLDMWARVGLYMHGSLTSVRGHSGPEDTHAAVKVVCLVFENITQRFHTYVPGAMHVRWCCL